jgi:hypothetical protein
MDPLPTMTWRDRMPLTTRRALGAVAIAVGLLLTIASAPALADASSCSTPTMTQPFASWGDYNWYTLVPGQTSEHFDGAGWTLTGGAKLLTVTLPSGGSAGVLRLPMGSSATSPATCVDATYQSARMMVRGVFGQAKVSASVSYETPSGWSDPASMGVVGVPTTWKPSAVLTLSPPAPGWQLARFTLSAQGFNYGSQLYNFYIDPYGRG